MAKILEAAGRAIIIVRPTRLLVVGDRLDMIPAVSAVLASNLPIVHLHGGEITRCHR